MDHDIDDGDSSGRNREQPQQARAAPSCTRASGHYGGAEDEAHHTGKVMFFGGERVGLSSASVVKQHDTIALWVSDISSSIATA